MSVQFAILATLLLVLAGGVLGMFFVRQQSHQIRESLEARGMTLAKNAAYHSEYGILIGSKEMIENLLAGMIIEPDVAYAVVQDARGSVLGSAGAKADEAVVGGPVGHTALEADEPIAQPHHLRSGAPLLEITAPVRTAAGEMPGLESSLLLEAAPTVPADPGTKRSERIGTVRVGMSLDRVNASIAGAARGTALLTAAVILCAVLLVFALGRTVTRPLHQLVIAAQRVAQGDLTLEIDERRRDEIGQLASTFNQMVRSLRTLIKRMQDGIIQVGAASSDIEGLAEQQTAGSVEQAVSVEEITSSLEELAMSAAGIAGRSESVVSTAEETVAAATGGQRATVTALEAMDRIRETVQNIARTTVRLGDRSQKIGDVLDIIQEISSETHLLAVNAAIESAAAGEHGRRFSVVAGEVHRLAERSRASAEEIAALVTEIQAAISASVMATEQGTKEVEAGVELARGVEKALEEILAMIEKTTQTAKEISLATQQQRGASDQVVAVIRGIADNARDAAEGMKRAAGLVAQLTTLAAGFREEASRFAFDDHPPAGADPGTGAGTDSRLVEEPT
ncbi:MAG: methyl-accepting chemotaxis protein [Armatimonadota bacterium]|nr:MAG: methyl-accepting chemotaxis protein [Armatimonadota bacterium]